MTTVETAPPGRSQPDRKKWHRRRGDLGDHVVAVVTGLQTRVLRDRPDPEAISALARLRRGVGRDPGSDYTLESYLFVPDLLAGFTPQDGPSDVEYAVHDAITLYALHQQSQRQRMFSHGNGLGVAAAILTNKVESARRRFSALGTAASYTETIYHLRNFITLLRTEEIPLDYGLLAEDLLKLRRPTGAAQIRATWGREFFRTRPSESATPSTTSDTPEENAS